MPLSLLFFAALYKYSIRNGLNIDFLGRNLERVYF
nr:MAG TPA: hypothetical protein [Caudoviricetes sp.]